MLYHIHGLEAYLCSLGIPREEIKAVIQRANCKAKDDLFPEDELEYIAQNAHIAKGYHEAVIANPAEYGLPEKMICGSRT